MYLNVDIVYFLIIEITYVSGESTFFFGRIDPHSIS